MSQFDRNELYINMFIRASYPSDLQFKFLKRHSIADFHLVNQSINYSIQRLLFPPPFLLSNNSIKLSYHPNKQTNKQTNNHKNIK